MSCSAACGRFHMVTVSHDVPVGRINRLFSRISEGYQLK